ncbi:MAG: phage portal protein, partial [Pseudomonadota bacterium]
KITNGVEYSRKGEVVAYWLFDKHPGDMMGITGTSKRHKAKNFHHIFEVNRPGQLRGLPRLTPVIRDLQDLSNYKDAELMRKRLEACLAGFRYTPHGGSNSPLVNNGEKKITMEPGTIAELPPGEDIKFSEPPIRRDYEDFMRLGLLEISAGIGITYAQLTGDLSDANYSSLRAGLLEFRRMMRQKRVLLIANQLCRPIFKELVMFRELNGITIQDHNPRWIGEKFDPVDPLKDTLATSAAIRNGISTLRLAITEQGGDPDQWLQDIADVNQQLDDLGIVLDSDPRNTAKSGTYQNIEEGVSNAGAS